jgi:hypothetical protein
MLLLTLSCSVELVRHLQTISLTELPEKFDIYSKIFYMDVEKFVRHLCRLVLRHQMPVWNYFVNSFYSVLSNAGCRLIKMRIASFPFILLLYCQLIPATTCQLITVKKTANSSLQVSGLAKKPLQQGWLILHFSCEIN